MIVCVNHPCTLKEQSAIDNLLNNIECVYYTIEWYKRPGLMKALSRILEEYVPLRTSDVISGKPLSEHTLSANKLNYFRSQSVSGDQVVAKQS